ncbi:hypothetical protein INS49_015298 [Diaporthe citri]|uniref:uncharacterized protein n=1 Tax=Diaporthe citri TaxID=83186 RepID=UPI001C7EB710|nr:uncharacterized protein INS49_015298 [Diaporthe citri]KAG6355914.1 hypothetical protein INS49_015298 [Diaporthe citri]
MPGIKVFHVTALATLLLSSVLLSIAAQDTCTTASQPNPIAQQYADTPTGTLNTTMAIVPIPLDTARRIVPAQHAILEGAYRALMPDFPADMYPVLVTAALDHDIQLAALSINVQDFQRFGWSFPFIDLLGDGYSSFTMAMAQMISADNEIAINGSRDYGTVVHPTKFEPGATDDSGKYVMLEFSELDEGDSNPFPIEVYRNITNQPIFANGTRCDRMVRLFNSTINEGQWAPVPVKGTVFSNLEPMEDTEGLGISDEGGNATALLEAGGGLTAIRIVDDQIAAVCHRADRFHRRASPGS